MVRGPARGHIPNGISISSAIFAGLLTHAPSSVAIGCIYVVLRCGIIVAHFPGNSPILAALLLPDITLLEKHTVESSYPGRQRGHSERSLLVYGCEAWIVTKTLAMLLDAYGT